MDYRPFGDSGISLSVIGLGGHEYLANGKSRGFNEDRENAIRPGYTAEGYGGPVRVRLLARAIEAGINFLDVTIDPEKEALGRNLREIGVSEGVFIQTRPEGMGYGYDPGNRKMARFDLLREEVGRILTLLQRDRIDILNFPFLQSALDEDPDYLRKIADNVSSLKDDGLIRFASADNFSGERTYLAQIETGVFESVTINLNICDDGPCARVLPAAAAGRMGVITREAFLKGQVFGFASEAGIDDLDAVARAAVKWNLSVPHVTTTLVGADTPGQLDNSLLAAESPELTDADRGVLEALRSTEGYAKVRGEKQRRFGAE